MAVGGERASEGDLGRVATRRVFYEDVGFRDRPGLWVHFLAEKVNLRLGVDRRVGRITVYVCPTRNVLLGDHQHTTGAAARVVHTAHDTGVCDALFITREHEIHHQMDDVAGCEVFAGVLV